jgi:hypothetical protein
VTTYASLPKFKDERIALWEALRAKRRVSGLTTDETELFNLLTLSLE